MHSFPAKLGNFYPGGASSHFLPPHKLKFAERLQREFHTEIKDPLNVNTHQREHAEQSITSFGNFETCQRKWNHSEKNGTVNILNAL